jgi:trimethylamine--corrinoid protein Co-methyltransferase
MAGAIALGNAETLAGLTIGQLKRRHSPFIFGGCVSSFDMLKMVLPYGSPEWQMANGIMCQLARRYGLPVFATGGCTDSKAIDTQAAAEGAFSLLMSALTGGNLIHDVGYMEGGLAGSPAYLAFCDEMIGYVKRILRGIAVADETIALEQVHSVGPHGDFLAEEHTASHYRNETWYPSLFDRNYYETWKQTGARTAEERAAEKARALLSGHVTAPFDSYVAMKLDELCEI